MIEENILMNILAEIRKLNKDSRLWCIEDIADYFGMSRTTVTRKIITQTDFPKHGLRHEAHHVS